MRMNIVKPIALLIVFIGMVGIVAAYDCPGPDQWDNVNTPSLQYFYTVAAAGTNPVTYWAGGAAYNSNSIREVCVASTSKNALSGTVSWPLWTPSDLTIKPAKPQWPHAWGQFKDGGEPNDILANGTMHEVGTLTWDGVPDQIFVLHVKDARCPGGNTCYVIPKGANPPVSEMSTMVLTSAGLLGIVLVSRKYKN